MVRHGSRLIVSEPTLREMDVGNDCVSGITNHSIGKSFRNSAQQDTGRTTARTDVTRRRSDQNVSNGTTLSID